MNPQLKQSSGTRSGAKKQNPQLVYCLCLDLTGSTKAGLSLTNQQNDRFNSAFVKQISPHWKSLVSDPELILKFTGDGWLFMTREVGRLSDLCCLALIQAKMFQREMSELTGTEPAQIRLYG
jgi:hypothetical protein